jgi:hypothetical protein
VRAAIGLVILLLMMCGCAERKKKEQTPAETTAPSSPEVSSHPITSYEIDDLRKNGLSDPIAQIVESLHRHPELIPPSGVLGGSMGFHDPDGIRVLSSHWVYARFDDGHVMGSGIFEFKPAPGESLTWKVVCSRIEE